MPIQSSPAESWHVLGAGSIGCLFAANLQRAGHAVRVILRDADRVAQWRASGGVALDDATGRHSIDIDASAAPDLPRDASIRQLLICTKAQQTRAAVAAIADSIAPDATLVLLQNGMGVREQLQPLLPNTVILHALSTEGAYRTARFQVVHAGVGSTVLGAAIPAQQPVARATASMLQCALRIDAVDDIEARLWLKLAVNSVINPLTALHECRNGDVPALPGIDALLPALGAEVGAVAAAAGQSLPVERIVDEVLRVCSVTAANRSSMLQDIAARRLTEIDFINGHILRVAAQHGIACPQQQSLYTRLKALERQLDCQ